jgi:hypothetical protein
MAFSRYSRSPVLSFGLQYGTSSAITTIRTAVTNGSLSTREILVRGIERLDSLAGEIYGDARYWWILAAASDIGWGLQVPPGTIIKIPELGAVAQLVA